MILLDKNGKNISGDFSIENTFNIVIDSPDEAPTIPVHLPNEVWKAVFNDTWNALKEACEKEGFDAMSVWNYRDYCELVIDLREYLYPEFTLIVHIRVSDTIRGEVGELKKLDDYEKFCKNINGIKDYKDVSEVLNLPKYTAVLSPEEMKQIAAAPMNGR